MTDEMVDEIWKRIADTYFEFKDDAHRNTVLDRIALVSVVRFLYLLESTDLKEGALGAKRIARSLEHIDELLGRVDNLAI